jgi:hypothetical protein
MTEPTQDDRERALEIVAAHDGQGRYSRFGPLIRAQLTDSIAALLAQVRTEERAALGRAEAELVVARKVTDEMVERAYVEFRAHDDVAMTLADRLRAALLAALTGGSK